MYLICIKPTIDYNIGDLIQYRLYEFILEQLLDIAWFEHHKQETILLSKLASEGKDLLNDFCGVDLHPCHIDEIWHDYLEFMSSFQDLSIVRQKQIDSVFLDDFDDLFKKN